MKPTGRSVALAWSTALVLVGILIACLDFFGHRQLKGQFAGVDTAFLGSSLTRHALPDFDGSKPFPQVGGQKALRIGLSGGSERQMLDLATAAVASGVEKVFIEINPIISRFSTDRDGCGLSSILRDHRRWLTTFADAFLRGREITAFGTGPADIDRPRNVDLDTLARLYPLKFDAPCYLDAWTRLLTASGKTRVFLIAMPRDTIAEEFIGARNMATFDRKAMAFSSQFGLPLFVPDASGSWGPEMFVDQAHMSRQGSERFVKELAAWWLAQK